MSTYIYYIIDIKNTVRCIYWWLQVFAVLCSAITVLNDLLKILHAQISHYPHCLQWHFINRVWGDYFLEMRRFFHGAIFRDSWHGRFCNVIH